MKKIVVALGNPGEKYVRTRHNAGWLALDGFLKKEGIELNHIKFSGIYTIWDKNREIIFAKPLTYMNLSGIFLKSLANFFKIKNENILVIYDDISLPLGVVRISINNSSGGHKGMENIIKALNSNEIPRIRIGINNLVNSEKKSLTNYVLEEFSIKEEQALAESAFLKVNEIISQWASGKDFAFLQNKYN